MKMNMKVHSERALEHVDLPVPAVDAGKAGIPGILFVDDELSALLGVRRALRSHFDIKAIDCPVLALKYLVSAKNVSVIVTDLQMPGMDGITFLKEASALHPDASMIILTGSPGIKSAIDAINEIDVARYLMKPCGLTDLVQALSSALCAYEAKSIAHQHRKPTLTTVQSATESFSPFSETLPTPLHQILLHADLPILGDRTRAVTEEYIDHLRNSGASLDNSIERITEYFRLCELDEPPCPTEFPIEGFFEDCRQRLALTAPEYNVEISYALDAGADTFVGDETLLKRAVIAMASKALVPSNESGSIDLAVHANADNIQIRLNDATMGATRAEVEASLEPFAQRQDGLIREAGGLNLGLDFAFVKQVTRIHGGDMLVMESPAVEGGLIVDLIIPQGRLGAAPGRFKHKLSAAA